MSYRNPQIIVDRSAEIYAGMATAGADAFNKYMAARKEAIEKAEKQDAGLLKAINAERENQEAKLNEGIDLAGGLNAAGDLVSQYQTIYQDDADPLVSQIARVNLGQTDAFETKKLGNKKMNLTDGQLEVLMLLVRMALKRKHTQIQQLVLFLVNMLYLEIHLENN